MEQTLPGQARWVCSTCVPILQLRVSQKDGQTPLIGASMNGQVAVVEALIKAGADYDATNHVIFFVRCVM